MTRQVENSQAAQLYRNVPSAELRRLQSFRRSHPYQTAVIKGMPWSYIDDGTLTPAERNGKVKDNERPVLLLGCPFVWLAARFDSHAHNGKIAKIVPFCTV